MYKGTMFSDVPNLAVSFGYVNASWWVPFVQSFMNSRLLFVLRVGNLFFVYGANAQDASS
jgi:hypothetical protein